jgi:hypothetical protein
MAGSRMLLALSLLTACSVHPSNKGQQAGPADYSDVAPLLQPQPPVSPEEEAARLERGRRDSQARAVCDYRAQVADAQGTASRDILGGIIAGTRTRDACMELYRRTGIVPQP